MSQSQEARPHLERDGHPISSTARLERTPQQVLGPYFPVELLSAPDRSEPSSAADLTASAGTQPAPDEIIEVQGQILNRDGDPVRGAHVIVWQANRFGRYAHPNDESSASSEPGFSGYAEMITDERGAYRIKTVKPGAYPIGPSEIRPPHIHFEVRGRRERLITQMYFPGEPLNKCDRLLSSTSHPELLIARALPLDPSSHRIFAFDVVLARG